jgi:hypothetical protein
VADLFLLFRKVYFGLLFLISTTFFAEGRTDEAAGGAGASHTGTPDAAGNRGGVKIRVADETGNWL